ncbi:type II secretion system protein [Candidatus Parcubacteria bacterium]|jgi:type II secretory pathway pseudopilin PulG|nr:type II secretion system protein [Candidatus Parcubacteria bacterium]MBT7227922.1 type II secretion system protein [Candidatus Parcubacteria bacterium]
MKGFTLARLIITVAVISVLAASVFVWIDPVAKIGQAKDRQRTKEVLEIVRAVDAYVKDHRGALPVLGAVPTAKTVICTEQGAADVTCDGNSAHCLRIADSDFYVEYLPTLPIDPDKTSNQDTGYYFKKGENNQLVVGACSTYGTADVVSTTTIQVSCPAYAGGYCWYEADATTKSCDTVCSDNGFICVETIRYASDVDSGDTGYCALNKAFGAACSSACFLGNDPTYQDYSPAHAGGGIICSYRTDIFPCDFNVAGYSNLCPCE